MNMTTTEQRLADALRDLLSLATYNRNLRHEPATTSAREALAAYDAQQAVPGPWIAEPITNVVSAPPIRGRAYREPVASCNSAEHAARIVQCVNAHDGLVSALQRCADRLGVLIECDNEDHGLAATADVDAYAGAVDVLAAAGVSP